MYKDKKIINNIEELKKVDIFQIIINSNKYYDMKQCEEFIIANNNLKIANYSRDYIAKRLNSEEPYYIFVNSKSTDKGVAISKFLEAMNINKEEAICFGDRINDITMFKSCGNTVAMRNADEELKKIANYITLSNDENGVADFLNKHIC
jgi:HAD superfamily hydrolase (TIGR01484 family)